METIWNSPLDRNEFLPIYFWNALMFKVNSDVQCLHSMSLLPLDAQNSLGLPNETDGGLPVLNRGDQQVVRCVKKTQTTKFESK